MFTLYNLLKFLHVLGVIVWLGGLFMMLIISGRFMRTRESGVMRAISEQGKFLGMSVFGPATGTVLITGIGMVQVGNLSFGSLWIMWGIVGMVLSAIVGGAIAGRMAARLSDRVTAGQFDVTTAAAIQRRIKVVGTVNLLILVSVVFAMVFKP